MAAGTNEFVAYLACVNPDLADSTIEMSREVWGGAGGLNTQETHVKPGNSLCFAPPLLETGWPRSASGGHPGAGHSLYCKTLLHLWGFHLVCRCKGSIRCPSIACSGSWVSHLNPFSLHFLNYQIGVMVPKSQGWHNVLMRWDIGNAQCCAWHIIDVLEYGTSSAKRAKVIEPLF